MPTRRNMLAADLAELRAIADAARAELRALPTAASRTPAQKAAATRARRDLVLARAVLNAIGSPTAADLDDAS